MTIRIKRDIFVEGLNARGLTQQALASEAKVATGTITNALARGCSLANVEAIGRALGLPDWRDLIREEDRTALGLWDPQEISQREQSITRLNDGPMNPGDSDHDLSEKTYLAYRKVPASLAQSPELVGHLESRYRCKAIQLCGKSYAATAIWSNDNRIIRPNSVLGILHQEPIPPVALEGSATLAPSDYIRARTFIKKEYTKGEIFHEGKDYRTTRIDTGDPPQIQGAYGLYYDSILTQYGIEWETYKALLARGLNETDSLARPGTLPLREAVEALGDPLYDGSGRCAALATSTLLVFKHSEHEGFYCLIRRRSTSVGVSPGMLHVAPAGMFEARNYNPWSVEINVWRELLEEVYNDKEELGSAEPESDARVLLKMPVNLLIEMIKDGRAEFSVTGICCDLLSLRHEICTILFVKDPSFYKARPMILNWEYEPANWATLDGGRFEVPWEEIDATIEIAANTDGIVPTGAACVSFGRAWLRKRHGL